MSEAIIPFLNENGKIINIGSGLGSYKLLNNSEDWKVKFSNPSITKEQLLSYMHEFEEGVKKGDYVEKGFPNPAYTIYCMSKLAINVYTMKVLSQRQDIKDKHIQVYA
jgi:NAD(P)-dependent dehydrogenase (short-subunit alcohol dehydrogenase family)